MKCTKCKKEIHGFHIGTSYPLEKDDMLLCENCFLKICDNLKMSLIKVLNAFTDWFITHENLFRKFNETDDKPDSNRDTSPD